MDSEHKTFGLGGFFMGAVIGAIVALLYAPKKGSELRSDIGELGMDADRKGRQLYSRAKRLPAKIAAASDDLYRPENVVGAAQSAGRHATQEAKHQASNLRHLVSSARSHRGHGRPVKS